MARALAGMLQKVRYLYASQCLCPKPIIQVGLLPANNHRQVSAAYKLYCNESRSGIELSYEFKRKFARTVSIDFLGLW